MKIECCSLWFVVLASQSVHADSVIFTDDFSYPATAKGTLPPIYWHEGSNAVWIDSEGHLRTDANEDNNGETYNASTVWLKKAFSGDLKVEFDAHVVVSKNGANNINFMFLFSDPGGVTLYSTRARRADGHYAKYHSSDLTGYIYTFVNNGKSVSRLRLRDCPGFHLLQENNANQIQAGKTYHVTLAKVGNRLTQAVNGNVYIDKRDDQFNTVPAQGLIGFRTWSTDLWWDNLKVTQLASKNATKPDMP